MIHLSRKNSKIEAAIALTRSKSESNRALILNALFDEQIEIKNLSDSDDTKVLLAALQDHSKLDEINIGHAGTSFRFLTAFLSSRSAGSWVLTGSDRMKERPVGLLVRALQEMGADISYLENEGYPPLKISGNPQLRNEVTIDAGISSQYISALMMIGSKLKGGLSINLIGEITSLPYLKMTASMMEEIGINVEFRSQKIRIHETNELKKDSLDIEADWSAASYWFGFVALADVGSSIELKGLNQKSRQGDAKILEYYRKLGVETTFKNGSWFVKKTQECSIDTLKLDLSDTPDVAQTIVCTCAGLVMGVNLTGLHTLRIKETDRLAALKNELAKFGVVVKIPSDDQLIMVAGQKLMKPKASIATYKDHRMAMAFAPLALKVGLDIENEDVVTKSYPNFWEDARKVINAKS